MSTAAPLFEVTDPGELSALLRALFNAKFRPVEEDPFVWGSPFIHRMAARMREAQLELNRQSSGAATAELWYKSLQDNEVLGVIKANLRSNAAEHWWSGMSAEAKVSYVRGCVEPFLVSDDFIQELIRAAEP
ncbi:hypothetical protein [Variovorax sp. PCZ-1]|uniref:hypothetical protein n=1 Tax=Variovorax sp. PCZ-1 TaxID=2835533 RepID=UPI001BCE4936|nr:hypothetical protein [Variovorax sp. PCZ-1]MBS7806379.1 hypothetical protein [Variovorax sp. PCZ-1]